MLVVSESGFNKYVRLLDKQDRSFLTKYQRIIVNYFNSNEFANKKLLLLFMEVGTGKTLTSLVCGIEGIRTKKFNRIVVLSPKSVQDEFENNLKLYYKLSGMPDMNQIRDKIIMIPYNANNSSTQFKKLFPNLEHTLFIIDEAHLFMKSVIKTSLLPNEEIKRKDNVGNAKKIYDMIDRVHDKKIICLTGTPSSKHPFETVPIFNLAGCNFPLNFDVFSSEYIDYVHNTIKNKPKLMKQIKGLVAYVASNSSSQKLKVSKLKIVEVEMSALQYKQYLLDYAKEVKERGFTNKRNCYGLLFGAKSSFHAKTFEDSIYWNDSLTNLDDDKNRYVGEIKIDHTHCPKVIKMFEDTKQIHGTCVFYFRFVHMYGTECMEKLLNIEGYHLPEVSNLDIFKKKAKRYVLFTGDVNYKTRIKWKLLFNDARNKYGDYIKYLILSPSGSVGVTLKNVRYLGIGSVEFNYSAIRQILGRVNRLNSHIDLPEQDRKLQNFIYIATKNMEFYNQHKKQINKLCCREAPDHNERAPTIERIIYQDSLKDDIINEAFRKCLIDSSIV